MIKGYYVQGVLPWQHFIFLFITDIRHVTWNQKPLFPTIDSQLQTLTTCQHQDPICLCTAGISVSRFH